MSDSLLPEYMLKFSGSEREDCKEEKTYELDSLRRENYGDLAVSLKDSRLIILKDSGFDRQQGTDFQKHNMHNLSQVVKFLTEGESLEEAADKAYSSKDSEIPYRLEIFLEDGKLPEKYREPFEQIREDWMPNANQKMDAEIREHLEYLHSEEDHHLTRASEIAAETYGITESAVRSRYRMCLEQLRDNYW